MFKSGCFLRQLALLLVLAALMLPCRITAAQDVSALPVQLSDYLFTRSAIPPASGGNVAPESCLSIRLDVDFYRQIEDLSNGLRIVNARNTVIPFALQQLTHPGRSFREEQLSGRIVREQQLPDGNYAVDFELEKSSMPVSSVEISGRQLTAGTLLSIAVGDGNSWQTAVAQLTLSDLTQYPEITTRRFPLKQKLFGKTVRFIINAPGAMPKLETVRIFTTTEAAQNTSAVTAAYPLEKHLVKSTPEALSIIFNSGNLPLTQLKIRSRQVNYYYRLAIAGSNDLRSWQTITSAAIRKLDLDCADTVDFPESRYKYLEVQLLNPGTVTPEDLHIEALGNCYNWLLPDSAQTRQILTVFYGATVKPAAVEQLKLPEYSVVSGTFRLTDPAANPLRKTGVEDRSSWPFLLGALLIAVTGFIVIWVFIELKNSSSELPAD